MRYYAVKVGKVPGIYNTWDECKANVDKFSGAKFKSFDTLEEAEAFLGIKKEPSFDFGRYDAIAYTDGSYNPSTGISGYGMVLFIRLDRYSAEEAARFSVGTLGWDGNKTFKCEVSNDGAYAKVTGYEAQSDMEANKMRNVAGEILAVEECVKIAGWMGVRSLLIRHDYIGISEWVEGRWQANNPYTVAYRDNITGAMLEDNMTIDFEHVKAHDGNTYNEEADKLAKAAVGV